MTSATLLAEASRKAGVTPTWFVRDGALLVYGVVDSDKGAFGTPGFWWKWQAGRDPITLDDLPAAIEYLAANNPQMRAAA